MAFIESGKTFDKEENQEKLKRRMENMDSSQYSLLIPSSLYKKVKLKLVKEERSMRSIILEMLEEYINI